MSLLVNACQEEPAGLKELEESDFALIQWLFGEKVRNHLERGSLSVKKTSAGGYLVSSGNILKECWSYLLRKQPSQTHKDQFDDTDSMSEEEKAFVERHLHDETVNGLFIPSVNDDETVKFCYKSREKREEIHNEMLRMRKYPEHKSTVVFPKHHLLNGTDKEWFRSIFEDCNDLAQPCLPALQPIMQKFMSKHLQFRYYHVINSLRKRAKCKFHVEMPAKALRELFSMLTGVVAPRELFGSVANVKKIKRGTLDYVFSRRREFFRVGSIIENLDMNAIGWLQIIDNMKTKVRVMRSFLTWFLHKYIKIIINNYFYQASSNHGGEEILVPIKGWIKYRDDFVNQMNDRKILEEHSYSSSDGIPLAFMKFHMKRDGLRPIYTAIPTPEQKDESQALRQWLKQAWALKMGDFFQRDLCSFWKSIVKVGKECGKPLYFVITDISDAYGSINQDKLLEIVQDITKELPEKLILRSFGVVDSKSGNPRINHEKQFYDKSLPLQLRPGTISAFDFKTGSSEHVPTNMFEKLTHYVKNQTVVIGDNAYRLNLGVGQGLSLSSILANIYYGTIEMEEFAEFRQNGWLARYVDDFLYVTEDKQSAEKFLKLIREGIPNYNCHFKLSKTHTNLTSSETNFTFLGYKFDIVTFEVEPDYSSPITQFTTSVDIVVAAQEATFFTRRLLNMQVLKLNAIVLNGSINSNTRITRTILNAAKRLAHKCRILVTYMLIPEDLNVKMISRVISESIEHLAAIVKRRGREIDEFKFPTRRVWQKFIDEFQKYKKLAVQLTPTLRKRKESIAKPKYSRKRKRSISDKEQFDQRSRIKLSRG